MYVLLIALVSNLTTGQNSKTGQKFIYNHNDVITYQVEYSSKEKCMNALKEMNVKNSYMSPVYLKCLPK